MLEHPIKTLGLARVRVELHPEVSIPVIVNVARSQEEAERQARGERVGAEAEEEAETPWMPPHVRPRRAPEDSRRSDLTRRHAGGGDGQQA